MRNIILDTRCPGLEIFADQLLEKVFYNLIDNSLRYGGEKMTAIRVTVNEGREALHIIYEDDGAGISAYDKKDLFTKGFGKHTGLGLYLSREILSITGITIMENGEPGKGERFEISVPKGAYRLSPAARTRPKAQFREMRLVIVLTDDAGPGCIEAGILENALVMIAALEKSGKIIAWNHAAETITGYAKDEVIGDTTVWKKLYPDKRYRDSVTARIAVILEKKNYFENFETTVRTKAGESRVILWNTKEISDGGRKRIVTAGLEINLQKELDAFRESIVEKANVLITVLGKKGEVLLWNTELPSPPCRTRNNAVSRHRSAALYPHHGKLGYPLGIQHPEPGRVRLLRVGYVSGKEDCNRN